MRRRRDRRRPAPGGAPGRRERPRDISQPYSAMVGSSLLGMVGRNSADAGELQQSCRGGREADSRPLVFQHLQFFLIFARTGHQPPEAGMQAVGRRSLTERMKGAALLEIDAYEEVE